MVLHPHNNPSIKPLQLEAPASSIARHMRAARSEGSQACGMSNARRMNESNATRDVDHLFRSCDLCLKVPRETFQYLAKDGNQVLDMHWVRPSVWIKFLLEEHPSLLVGTKRSSIQEQLLGFWTTYRKVHPNHAVFDNPDPLRLSHTLPIFLHGDEGRYLKRSNYMLCTVESVLGSSRYKCAHACDCSADPVLNRYPDLQVDVSAEDARAIHVARRQSNTMKGHCYLSRFLCFGMASQQYKACEGLLDQAFGLVAEDMGSLVSEGLLIGDPPNATRFWVGYMGVKGDMKFHHQVGHLNRSYFNLGKKTFRPLCHLCMAGSEGQPMESLADEPAWAVSEHVQEPWHEAPALAQIPYDKDARASCFRLDPFHLLKVGHLRDLCGSGVVALCYLGKFDFEEGESLSIESRLNRAHGNFSLWCTASHKTPALRSFSKLNFNIPNASSYAWVNCKGSDASLILSWLLFFIRTCVHVKGEDPKRLFKALEQSLESAIVFYKVLQSHRLWLQRPCAQRAQHHLLRMLRGYKVCSQECFNLQLACFGLKPKLHALHHMSRDLSRQLSRKAPLILSPLACNCEAHEDMVGRISRLARRVSSRTVNARVFERLLYKSKALVRRRFSSSRGRKA